MNTKNLIQTITTNIKNTRGNQISNVEKIEKVNASIIKNRTKSYLGKPKNEKLNKTPRNGKNHNRHIKTGKPNKADYSI